MDLKKEILYVRILGIETSCDETGAAVIEGNPDDKQVVLLSNVIASSLSLHAKTGGIIPEVAAREQLKYILPVIDQALADAKLTQEKIDAIAVTFGPGLIGSLLVGVETAKTLAYTWNKPIIPVNHLVGHIYANFVRGNSKFEIRNSKFTSGDIQFPAIALVVSGGHTDLVLMKKHGSIMWIGGTRDDAAGEAFDKIGRLLNLPYPAGPVIAKLAEKGNAKAFNFPRPMIGSKDFDFSFSGLKTAVLCEVKAMKQLDNDAIADLSASVQQAIVDVLVRKTTKAAQKYKVKSFLLAGGVAANELLRKELEVSCHKLKVKFFVPTKNLCTDNAAMIASAAFFTYDEVAWEKITANPGLHFV